jgi:hypothetical protein
MTQKSRTVAFLLLFALAGVLAPVSAPGIMVKVELPDLVADAGKIVHGIVVGSESRVEDGGAIFTYTTVDVLEDLLGTVPDDIIVIRNMGGRVGEKSLVVSDVPTFVEGEEVVLFIEAAPRLEETDLVGWEQGKFAVKDGMVERTRTTVEEFKSEIRSLLEGSQMR